MTLSLYDGLGLGFGGASKDRQDHLDLCILVALRALLA
jgi:hypothetical protein